ncbi:MobQ family relaxase [Achromobacter sp. Marseille-Q4954]|uniref:MobQ family relaxase n=1 Tax=Achromobacter sp. Marseille-Q4954 TaxID=2942203 RepID=UPI0020736456|nr:MobQ family relaxase [Achromobacter sp. Marseille-Q4954]
MYRLELNYISRDGGKKGKQRDAAKQGHGFSATAAAAYRSGGIVTDYRTGEVHDYTRKRRIDYTEIVLPPGAPSWASHREALWNAVEAAEARKDARLAHEFIVALPHGLTKEQEIKMVRDLAQRIADRHGIPVDWAIHGDDPKMWDGSQKGVVGSHAHLLMPTRELTPEGFSKIKGREFIDRKLGPKTLRYWREQWALIGNEHIERAGLDERWDHRTLSVQREDALERGDIAAAEELDRLPGVHIGAAATALERQGIDTYWGNLNRIILAQNAERRLGHERKRIEESMAALERRLAELRAAQEADATQPEPSDDDPRWAAFERTFMHAVQFEHGLSLIGLTAPMDALKARFSAYMDTAEEQGMTPEEFAQAYAKGLAEQDRRVMQEQAARDADPKPPQEDSPVATPAP